MTVSSLEEARIKFLPSSAFYVADFITEEEEEIILKQIATAPKPRWKQLAHRRIQIWPSALTQMNTLIDSRLPTWLTEPVISRLLSYPISKADPRNHIFSDSPHGAPNHVLINEYKPGEGIMPHKDGAAYYPVVCTVSLGSSLTLGIYAQNENGATEADPRWRILQEPRSLLITTDKLYAEYLHGISEVAEEVNLGPGSITNWDLLGSPEAIIDGRHRREKRTSLTYRDVLKVSKLGSRFAMLSKS